MQLKYSKVLEKKKFLWYFPCCEHGPIIDLRTNVTQKIFRLD